MKQLVFAAALVLMAGLTASATVTDALKIQLGASIATIQDNGSCVNVVGTLCAGLIGDLNPTQGTDTISGTVGGWSLSIVSGTSHTPTLVPFGIDVSSLTASCTVSGGCTGAANQLHVIYSDINFGTAVPAGGFQTSFSDTQSGTGTVTENAYFSNGNGLFTETTLIGSLSFTSTNHGTASGGPIAAVPNYSLTLEQIFDGGDATSFSVDGNITAVPEPVSVALFGTVLVLCGARLRRRKA